jgi:serine beta-lactamase-like protein LACTB
MREAALKAEPPREEREFLDSDLLEVSSLDPTIRYDIRYATNDNLLSTPLYEKSSALLQRPAAEALLRAHESLREKGLGLCIFDAYRPWYITKLFHDAAPEELKQFFADPARGSRHNRGCAVDLTLYDLKTGKPVEMVSEFDEITARSRAYYPGGTSLQRHHRRLLRQAMEAQGFAVLEEEWWHFDYPGWEKYAILNQKLD